MNIKSLLLSLLLIAPAMVGAQTALMSSDFATFTPGDLVGQNGWTQLGTVATNPIAVSNGSVIIPGGSTTNDQDAIFLLSTPVAAPTADGQLVQVAFNATMVVNAAGANPSYFMALRGGTFDNARMVAKANTANTGYTVGVRVNGQSGYPFVYGTTEFSFGQTIYLRAVLSMVPGNANDIVELYVGTSPTNLVKEATAAYVSGTVGDPVEVSGVVISQFGSSTVQQSDVAIKAVGLSLLPPSTSVDRSSELVNAFKLEQNYPNPFNPSTVVGFQLSVAGEATLKVYDLLGREVAVLVNGTLPAGAHSVTFDASNLTSGVYLYKLEAGGMSQVRRMTLVK